MHYAVRLKFTGVMGGTSTLSSHAHVERGLVLNITTNGDLGWLDLGPIQTPPADKPLYLQSIGVALTQAGMDGHRVEAVDPLGGPSFVLLDLKGVTSRFDSAGWLLPVGYQLRFTGPTGTTTAPNVVRLDFWQFDNVAQVLTKGQSGAAGGAALPVGPAGGDLTGNFPNPYVSAIRSGTNSLAVGAVADGQLLARSGASVVGVEVPSLNGVAASGDLSGSFPSPQVSAVTAGTTRLAVGSVGDGQYLMRSGHTLIGGAPASSSTTFGQGYLHARQPGPITSPAGSSNYVEVVSLAIPAVTSGQFLRLSWFLELLIQAGSEWGCRLVNKATNAVISPADATYGEYRIRNAMDGWQIPHGGVLLIDSTRGAFTCALQVRSPTSNSVVARNALLECFRVV